MTLVCIAFVEIAGRDVEKIDGWVPNGTAAVWAGTEGLAWAG
jgi:hypothetical protein